MTHYNVAILYAMGARTLIQRLRLEEGGDEPVLSETVALYGRDVADVCEALEAEGAEVAEAGPGQWVATRTAGWRPSAPDVAAVLAGRMAWRDVTGRRGPEEAWRKYAALSNSGPDTPLSRWEALQIRARRG